MKKKSSHAVLAAALAAGLALAGTGSAFAQVQPPAAAAPEAVVPQTDATPIDPGPTSSTGPAGDFGSAIEAIGRNSASAAALRTMTEVGAVVVVDLSEIPGSDPDRLSAALADHADGVKEVQESLQASAALHQALEAEGVDDTQVVAAEVGADGGLVVYVK